jgi:DNA-binding transcriptional ArsR family regulator
MKKHSSNNKTYHLFFGNLSNPLRIEIIGALKDSKKGLTVNELAKELAVEQSKLSHALAGLRECNLVEVKKLGKTRVYSLNKNTLLPILEIIDKHSKKFCGGNCSQCMKN